MGAPDLFLLAEPSGSGRTPLFDRILASTGLDFLNADRIAALRWPGDEVGHGHAAARKVGRLHDRYLGERRSFVTQSAFSPPSRVDFARRASRAGYRVQLRVLMVPVELSAARVAQRVLEDGHDVPADRIVQRYA